jgi:hypothetical protein
MAGEPLEARTDDGLAANLPILLGPFAAGAKPTPGSHHHGRDHAIHVSTSAAKSFNRPGVNDCPWNYPLVKGVQTRFRASVSEFTKSGIYCTAALANLGNLAKLYAGQMAAYFVCRTI